MKGDGITREISKRIVDTLDMYANYSVVGQRGQNIAVSFITKELALTFNDYLRCLIASRQARNDRVLLQHSA